MVRRDKVLVGALLLGLVMFVAFTVVLRVTDQQVASRLAEAELPDSVEEYQARVEAVAGALADAENGEIPADEVDESLRPYVESAELLARLRSAVDEFMNSQWHKVYRIGRAMRAPEGSWDVAEVAALLGEAQPLLADIHDLAGRPFFSQASPVESDLRNYNFDSCFYGCSSLLAIDATYRAYAAEPRAAFEDIRAGLQLAQTLVREPIATSQNACWTLDSRMTRLLNDVFAPGDLPSPWLDELIPLLERPPTMGSYLKTYALGATDLVRHRKQIWGRMDYREWVNEAGFYWGSRNWLWGTTLCRPMTNMDDQSLLDLVTRIDNIPDLPYHELTTHFDALEDYGERLPIVCHSSRQLVHNVRRGCKMIANLLATLDTTSLGLQVERYYADHGAYPPDLSVFNTPDHPLPVDPFTGGPYRYVILDEGFLLYSAGDNGVDDVAANLPSPHDQVADHAVNPPDSSESPPQGSEYNTTDDVLWRGELYVPDRSANALLQEGSQPVQE